MRRMYSEQELTNTIKAVFEQELADGALDENVADAVDAYLVEHPVDITALEGLDISVNSIEADTAIKYLSKIVDENTHARFIECDVNLGADAPVGMTKTYGKWSLSGSHLMIVLAGTIADTTAISWGVLAVCAGLPQWVLDKIYPMTDSYVDKKAFDIFGSDLTTQSLNVWLRKSTSLFLSANALTLSADRSFRISFDLLID